MKKNFSRMLLAGGLAGIMQILAAPFGTAAAQVMQPPITYEPVDPELKNLVNDAYPNGLTPKFNMLNPNYRPVLPLAKSTSVDVTFLQEGAGYLNSLGWYAYSTDSPIMTGTKSNLDLDGSGIVSLEELQNTPGVETGWVFPNSSASASGGNLRAGDTVSLGNGKVFEAGTTIAFFLVQNAWTGTDVRDTNQYGTDEAQVFYASDHLNPEAPETSSRFTELSGTSRHMAMMFADDTKSNVIVGLEDLNRQDQYVNDRYQKTDNDFNDIVFQVTAPVAGAFDANIATAPVAGLGSGLAALPLAIGLIPMFTRRNRRISAV
jgi:hypothetical protein